MPKRRLDGLRGSKREFADKLISGVSKTQAYLEVKDHIGTDNAGHRLTVNTLLADPNVRDYVIERLAKYGVSMRVLGDKLLQIVDKIADDYKRGEADTKEALMAAKIGLDFIVKCNGADLFRQADDKATALMSRADMARKIVGPPVDVEATEVPALVPASEGEPS